MAFERMAGELEALGAPADLVSRARRSAIDETRHAQVMNPFVSELPKSDGSSSSDTEPLRELLAFLPA